jgi:hypothetical protein
MKFKFIPQTFNDFLAILAMIIVFPGLWICQGRGLINLPEGIIGATIAIETLIAQFYFRKAPAEEKGNETIRLAEKNTEVS